MRIGLYLEEHSMMEWLQASEHAYWVDLGINIGGRLLGALVLLLIGLRLARGLGSWIGVKLQNSALESTAAIFLGNHAGYFAAIPCR